MYLIYRLWVESEFPLPLQYQASSAPPDVSIRNCGEYNPNRLAENQKYFFAVGRKTALFRYRGIAEFEINNGCEIKVSYNREIDYNLVVNTILGTPMGIILLQRGFLVLHASAVKINNKVVCFLGKSGAGKSTTVCALVAAGYKLVSDDVVAIDTSSRLEVMPGYPWMKIGDEIITQLKIKQTKIEQLGKNEIKKRYNVPSCGFVAGCPCKVSGFYILNWAEEFSITRMAEPASLINLIGHEYGFVPKADHASEEAKRFLRSAALIKKVPCFNLKRPKSIDRLHQLVKAIEAHVLTLY